MIRISYGHIDFKKNNLSNLFVSQKSLFNVIEKNQLNRQLSHFCNDLLKNYLL